MASKKTIVNALTIPTDDRRHIGAIREGKISGEEFCRDAERRKELGLSPLPVAPIQDFIEELRA